MAAKKAASKKGKRYNAAEKAEILNFVAQLGRGGATQAAKKYGISPLTLSNWKKSAGSGARKAKSALVDKDSVLKGLASKGFKIIRSMNIITGEILEDKIDPKIDKLNLEFGGIPAKPTDSSTYVVSTSGPVMVTMTLDRLLAITGTKP
ncbi:MAG: hypothetical protein EAZ65_01960 [Verrucomicrobia bacterium]|nr:MAG: hypothetical protein EAZ84_08005 [Verrucomicrobiota bacterium]TAE85873.1 MAG: hypothetical protein EAZ82_12620 [Verrucomicrobiota bacterium]TAF27376.1 MAG: hypothetical protein EAZ71_02730 [Verrucomicrobiota bacterium]TAF42333.1 MAG: hypothetical protein EAZ65_01960 [Verrucomicrobiota bacterium]